MFFITNDSIKIISFVIAFLLVLLLRIIYHKTIVKIYTKKIINAINDNDKYKVKHLLLYAYKRQPGKVYRQLCKKIDMT